MLHLGPIWYHSEPSDVPYSENLPRPIFWFELFLRQNDSRCICGFKSYIKCTEIIYFCVCICEVAKFEV